MILSGGSGSTGSSLLQAILHRHPAILAGQETCLFIYPHLFYKWQRYKNHLISRGIWGVKSTGWSYRNGADLLHPDYGWEEQELKNVIRQSLSFRHFVQQYFEKAMLRKGASLWIEKTPQNAVSFQTFLKEYSQGKVIQMIRNPLDTMASLIARGFHPYDAAGYYIYHTAAAASVRDNKRYFLVEYERLVADPGSVIRPLFAFLKLDYDAAILQPTAEELAHPLKIDGWNHSERGAIEKSSVGRFDQLDDEDQRRLIAALNVFKISDLHLKKHRLRLADYRAVCEAFGYEHRQVNPAPYVTDFKKFRFEDMKRRTLKLHPGHFLAYPGGIVS